MCKVQLGVAVFWLALIAFVLSLAADEPAGPGQARPKAPLATAKATGSTKFIRVRRLPTGEPVALETATVSYGSASNEKPGLVVDLIGAVHLADKSYYEQLNRILPTYDVLLYELVAPSGSAVPVPGGGRTIANPITGVQLALKSVLGLEFQLDQIDYRHENFVHADMSPEEFSRSMKKRGESIWQMVFRMLGHSAAEQAQDPTRSADAAILMALFSRDRALRLKRIMAGQFEDLEASIAGLSGPDGSTIITERNRKALQVLRREMQAGNRRIGVFYGVGHLPDMQKRLRAEFGLTPVRQRWLTAWSLRASEKPRQSVDP